MTRYGLDCITYCGMDYIMEECLLLNLVVYGLLYSSSCTRTAPTT
jgi:hypothetical protein